MMAGDFFDVFPLAGGRLAAVIGDVAGHGIDPSISAFQVKYLLRTFVRQYRDPAQALEELNKVLSISSRPEDLVSVCVVILDPAAGTLRHASAGHPATWLWQDSEVHALRSTGPLLTLDPDGTYFSRERPLLVGDVILMYTDGLAEARSGGQIFGEDRIAAAIRRDPGQDTTIMWSRAVVRRLQPVLERPEPRRGQHVPDLWPGPVGDDQEGPVALQAHAGRFRRLHGLPGLLADRVAAEAHLRGRR
jgi:hypothetical protein